MIKLDKSNYYKVTKPLKAVTFNKLFARAVIENRVSGSVYVDDVDNPSTFYVVHPYGMSLLFGDNKNEEFNTRFKDYALNKTKSRKEHEWMQAFPNSWDSILKNLFIDCIIKSSDNVDNKENGIIELNTRINFKFNLNKYINFKKSNIKSNLNIVRADKNIFTDMKGSVVPSLFWSNADDFNNNGVGFSLFHDNKLAATAYSACILDNKLELGIETVEEFRGKGFALYTCSSLIDYCIENNFEPIWACRIENIGSYKLAQKLGFEPTISIPYYKLST